VTDDLLIALGVVAGAAVLLQLADAIGTTVDAITMRDTDEPDAVTRRRWRSLSWALALTATLAVGVAFAVDAAARRIWVDADPGSGAVILLATALAAFAVGVVGVLVLLRRERPTYARLRRDLRDRSTFTIDPAELAEFEERLARADRVRERRPRAALVLRVVGLVVVLATAALLGGARLELLGWVVAAVVLELAAVAVSLVAARLRWARLDAVLALQRREVVALLERARIPPRGRVPGLGDRVARALAILREKQSR
jgi:hypothetical protein